MIVQEPPRTPIQGNLGQRIGLFMLRCKRELSREKTDALIRNGIKRDKWNPLACCVATTVPVHKCVDGLNQVT